MMTMTMVLSGWELGLPNSGGGLPQMTIFLSQNFPHWPFHIFSHFHLNNSRVSFFTKYFLHDFVLVFFLRTSLIGRSIFLQIIQQCRFFFINVFLFFMTFILILVVRAAECSFVSKQIWRCFLAREGEACTL